MDKADKEDTREIIEVAVAEVVSEKPKLSLVKHAIEKNEYAGKLGTGIKWFKYCRTSIDWSFQAIFLGNP